jgi:hypothetical protein
MQFVLLLKETNMYKSGFGVYKLGNKTATDNYIQ